MAEDLVNLSKYAVGDCLKPRGFNRLPYLSPSRQFMSPATVDCRDYMTPTEFQGDKPWCAAYAVANWAESMLWRKNDFFEQIKPDWIYAFAKEKDGLPNQEGTTLTAALEALRGSVFDRDICKVKVIRPNQMSFKFALHKFGAVVAGFNISEEWYQCNPEHWVICDSKSPLIGGHAVIVCGYDREGVFIQNSWGALGWGKWGFGKISWDEFLRQIQYGAVLSNVLDGLTINT